MILFNNKNIIDKQQRMIDIKNNIACRFSQAASSYDEADKLQQDVAKKLLNYLPIKANNIIDLGCGTGKWTTYLAKKYRPQNTIGVDIAWGMLQQARQTKSKTIQWCLGDIEKLPLPNQIANLVFSNLAVQWCSNLSQVLHEAYRILQPGGYFIFSTLAQSSFQEIQKIQKKTKHVIRTNPYLSVQTQYDLCKKSPFDVQYFNEQKMIQFYHTPLDLLKNLKRIGANTLTHPVEQSIKSHHHLKQFLSHYEKLRTSQGIPCTYQVILCTLTKK
ncbi:MAG: malonyl-ACP O-methyltransferase BioC [Endozoicomonadaceae bacterium]|nr:malonyl-ACP O-methyltransferase BioC [Endozoicomonadaceae bacterium]